MPSCQDKSVQAIDMLKQIFGGANRSAWNTAIDSHRGCNDSNGSVLTGGTDHGTAAVYHGLGGLQMHTTGRDIYAYVTPVIIVIGIFGNLISVKVDISIFSSGSGFFKSVIACHINVSNADLIMPFLCFFFR